MSPKNASDSAGSGLPVWTGKSADPMQWDNYRYAVEGYCIRGEMSDLLKPDYVSSPDQEDRELQEKLLGILLQTNRDMAGVVVRPFAKRRDGVGAWRALITRYGNESLELQQAKQIEYQQKVSEVKCTGRDGMLDTMHRLEHLFSELDKLDCVLPDAYKRNAVLLQLREVAPEIYTALAVKTDLKFSKTVGEVKKLAALNSAVDNTVRGVGDPTGVFFSKTNRENKRGHSQQKPTVRKWEIQRNQCFWCLKFGHMVENCPRRKEGEDPKPRPDGSLYKGRFEKGGGAQNPSSHSVLPQK